MSRGPGTIVLVAAVGLLSVLASADAVTLLARLRPDVIEMMPAPPSEPVRSIGPSPAPPVVPHPEEIARTPNDPPAAPVDNELHMPAELTEPPPPAACAAAPARPGAVAAARVEVKRIRERTADQLIHEAAKAPALSLDRSDKRAESLEAIRAVAGAGFDATPALMKRRPDLVGLPIRSGVPTRLGPASIRHLTRGAEKLKGRAGDVATLLAEDGVWGQADRIPAMMQVLMAESQEARMALARHLGGMKGKAASAALARIALYDPAPEVRREAIMSLDDRPSAEYRAALLRGFASPWAAPAEHAAEALVALRRADAAQALLAVWHGSDPQAPYHKDATGVQNVKEVVRVNHRLNCLMCHPVSTNSADPLRRAVPPIREQGFGYSGIGLGVGRSAGPRSETFVRADVTYLRQDYSVKIHGERFDLFVRERRATQADVDAALARKKRGRTPHQEAAGFALRELSGQEPGARDGNWIRFTERNRSPIKER